MKKTFVIIFGLMLGIMSVFGQERVSRLLFDTWFNEAYDINTELQHRLDCIQDILDRTDDAEFISEFGTIFEQFKYEVGFIVYRAFMSGAAAQYNIDNETHIPIFVKYIDVAFPEDAAIPYTLDELENLSPSGL